MFSSQLVTNSLLEWRLFLVPLTARRPTQSSPSVMHWECHTSRPNGNTKCRTTGTRSMLVCTRISPHLAEPFWIWCTSSSGGWWPWCTTTVQVRIYSWIIFESQLLTVVRTGWESGTSSIITNRIGRFGLTLAGLNLVSTWTGFGLFWEGFSHFGGWKRCHRLRTCVVRGVF